jgi:hypothetical protein
MKVGFLMRNLTDKASLQIILVNIRGPFKMEKRMEEGHLLGKMDKNFKVIMIVI